MVTIGEFVLGSFSFAKLVGFRSFREIRPGRRIHLEPIDLGPAKSTASVLPGRPTSTSGPKIVSKEPPDLSVIIPAYNEENRLGGTLKATVEWLGANIPRFELIVVDDGSRDGTREVAGYFMGLEPRVKLTAARLNRGKGYSVQQGALASEGKLVLFMDADNSTPGPAFGF